jgi:rod shape determining protein RodA
VEQSSGRRSPALGGTGLIMVPFVPRPIAELPWRALWIVLALALIGAVALYSVSPIAGGSFRPYAIAHIIRFGTFFAMAVTMSYVRPATYQEWCFAAYFGVILLLILVMGIGAVAGGARSWLDLGPLRLQPSELMKPVLVLVLARFYASVPPREIRRMSAIWPAALLVGFPILLILLQPDLGTSMLIICCTIVMMFLAGLPLWYFLAGIAASAVTIPLAFQFLLLPHQRDRILIFLNPEQDTLGAGYHLTQSKIAIGSGGLFGKGLLHGTQASGDFLPEPHTDFIFAAYAEEWGLAGGLVVILLFTLLFGWGMRVANEAKTRFEKLAAIGMTATIFFYMSINLLMVMGLAPVVGIPLPLVSYGGSAMLTVMICLGVLMSIDRNTRRDARRS